MRQPKAIFFDLDGTLLNSLPAMRESWVETVEKLGGPFAHIGVDEVLAMVGRPLAAIAGEFGLTAADATMLGESYKTHNKKLLKTVPLFPGGRDALVELNKLGFQLGIVTAKSRESTEISLLAHDLRALLDVVVVMEDTPKHKPDPMPLSHAAMQLGLTASDVVYVGDTTFDLDAARNFGCPSIGVSWGVHGEDALEVCSPLFVAQEMEQIPSWFRP